MEWGIVLSLSRVVCHTTGLIPADLCCDLQRSIEKRPGKRSAKSLGAQRQDLKNRTRTWMAVLFCLVFYARDNMANTNRTRG